VGVVIMIPGGAVFGDLGAGNGPDGPTDEGAGFVADKGTGTGTEGTTDEGAAFARRAGNQGRGRHESKETENQGVFHGDG